MNDSTVPENVCKICNKVFSRKADCNRHRRLHFGIKPYPCEVPGCGKRFSQFTALKTHLNVHTGSKPFKCGAAGCKSTFGDPSSCARHRREIHHPGKPFKCPYQGCTSSILRSSSFKIHLKKHGLDPNEYPEFAKRSQSPSEVWQSTEPEGTREGQGSGIGESSHNQAIPLPGLPNAWDAFISLPMDTAEPPLMQPGLTARVSSNSPLLLAPTPQVAPEYNAGYFLSAPAASPEASGSSRYSSPMARTPVLTPEIELGFVNDINAQMNPCLGTVQGWMPSAWQDQGIRYVG